MLTIFVAGLGIGLLLSSDTRRASALEYFGLAFLFGAAFVSLASFGLGLFLSGFWLRWSVADACLIAGVGGALTRRPLLKRLLWPKLEFRSDGWWLIALALQIVVVVWACYRLWLGWDALLIWEFKARIAFLSGGAIPLSHFENPTGVWPHTSYPLLLPLAEAWIYNWLGRPDQELVKLLLPFFYLSVICLLGAGGARFGGRRWQAWLAPILLFCIPVAWIGEGSASSGYADFPLAAFYLATVIYLVEYWESGDGDALRLMSALGAILFWVKQEGVILWACVVLLAVIKAIRRRKPRELLIIILPGALLFGGWRIFLNLTRAPLWTDFLPVSFATFRSHLGLLPEICGGVAKEFLRWGKWGILWPSFICASYLLIKSRSRAVAPVLLFAVLLPVVCYSGVYLFSAISPVTIHIASSFSRLLVHVMPAALLFIILAAAPQDPVQE
jgi:hypothetical protein